MYFDIFDIYHHIIKRLDHVMWLWDAKCDFERIYLYSELPVPI